ncbi:MAG: NUDIX hydrolase [Sphingomonadaceae bacterium]
MTQPAAPAQPDAPTTAWRGRWLEVVVEGGWEYARRPVGVAAAAVLAITDEGEAVLVEQRRIPVGAATIELPAGLVGDVEGETPEQAARRELREETGFEAEHWRHLGDYVPSPGMTAERIHLFLATGLRPAGNGGGVGDERIAVHRVRLADMSDFLAQARAAGLAVDLKLLMLLPWTRIG